MSWKDELKAEVKDLQTSICASVEEHPMMQHLVELSVLLEELIDHIPEEQETK